MTSSILVPHAGKRNGYDLQVLKDFALSAPWEWRKALEALIEEVEGSRAAIQKAEDRTGVLQDAVDSLVKEFRLELIAHPVTELPDGLHQSFTESIDAIEKVSDDDGEDETPKEKKA